MTIPVHFVVFMRRAWHYDFFNVKQKAAGQLTMSARVHDTLPQAYHTIQFSMPAS